jgi:hypothetical protein
MLPIPVILAVTAGVLYALRSTAKSDKTITDKEKLDIVLAEASRLGIDPAVAMAILQVESNGSGFQNGRLVIRFEPGVFKKYYGLVLPSMSFPDGYSSQDRAWARLEAASEIDKDAALLSTSYGSSQIMGFNYKVLGYPSVEAMWLAFNQSEDAHVFGLFKFLENYKNLLSSTRAKDFYAIAATYNGDKTGTYQNKMQAAYDKWKTVLG